MLVVWPIVAIALHASLHRCESREHVRHTRRLETFQRAANRKWQKSGNLVRLFRISKGPTGLTSDLAPRGQVLSSYK
jgi:hypothetical protein